MRDSHYGERRLTESGVGVQGTDNAGGVCRFGVSECVLVSRLVHVTFGVVVGEVGVACCSGSWRMFSEKGYVSSQGQRGAAAALLGMRSEQRLKPGRPVLVWPVLSIPVEVVLGASGPLSVATQCVVSSKR